MKIFIIYLQLPPIQMQCTSQGSFLSETIMLGYSWCSTFTQLLGVQCWAVRQKLNPLAEGNRAWLTLYHRLYHSLFSQTPSLWTFWLFPVSYNYKLHCIVQPRAGGAFSCLYRWIFTADSWKWDWLDQRINSYVFCYCQIPHHKGWAILFSLQ